MGAKTTRYTEPEPTLLDMATVATLLGMSSGNVRYLCHTGALRVAVRSVAGHRFFRRADVDRYVKTRSTRGRWLGRGITVPAIYKDTLDPARQQRRPRRTKVA